MKLTMVKHNAGLSFGCISRYAECVECFVGNAATISEKVVANASQLQ